MIKISKDFWSLPYFSLSLSCIKEYKSCCSTAEFYCTLLISIHSRSSSITRNNDRNNSFVMTAGLPRPKLDNDEHGSANYLSDCQSICHWALGDRGNQFRETRHCPAF